MNIDPYETLGVSRKATVQEIMAAFHQLSKKYPPQRDPEIHKCLLHAFRSLVDPEVRQRIDLEHSDQAVETEVDCSDEESEELWVPDASVSLKAPRLWVGYVLANLLFLVEIVRPRISELNWPFLILSIASLVYWFFCVWSLHVTLQTFCPFYPVSPRIAFWGHLIPIFNLYWVFSWPMEFTGFVKRNGMARVIPGWLIGLVILVLFLVRWILSAGLATFFLFMVVGYLYNRLCDLADIVLPTQGASVEVDESIK